MKKNIILEFDSFSPDKVFEWLTETQLHKKHKILVLTRPERKEKFHSKLSEFTNLRCISYDDLFNYSSKSNLNLNIYYDFVKLFFNDSLPARFLDREGYFPKYGIGVQSAFSYYTDVAYNLLSFLKDHNVEILYYRNTPHEFVEFFTAKAAEFLEINIYTSEQLVLPWIYTLRKGIGKQRKRLFKDTSFEEAGVLKKQISDYVTKLNGKYEDAMPLYEKNRLGKGLFKYYNPFENPLHLIKRPQKFWCMTRNFFYYKKHSKFIDYKNLDYFLFFLHYQPERSTLPEGYGFEDQFYAIKILSKMLPKGVRLVVKEHPSMFSRGSEFKIRSIYNYDSILSLGNVDLCSMAMDNFQLMDNAMAVSTITGTVALEGYVRQKPVILFGRSTLKVEGAHGFTTIENLNKFVNKVIQGDIKINNVVENLVNLCAYGSFSGLDDEFPVMDYYTKRKYKQNAHLRSLTALLS
jgi:hypothetical protein